MIRTRIAAAAVLAALSSVASAAQWSDTSIGYRTSNQYTEPGVGKDISRGIVNFTHISGYSLGTNFFSVDLIKSLSKEKANALDDSSNYPPQEVYLAYRHNLSLSKATGSNMAFGPVKDVALTAGFDFNSKNDTFGAGLRKLLVGPTVSIAIPAGFLDVSLLGYDETNNNAFAPDNRRNFDTTAQLGVAWGVPFQAGLPAVFKGFGTFTGEKGLNTKPETLVRAAVLWDVGVLGGKKDTFYAGVGYEFWNNKFGVGTGTGIKTEAPVLQVEAKF